MVEITESAFEIALLRTDFRGTLPQRAASLARIRSDSRDRR